MKIVRAIEAFRYDEALRCCLTSYIAFAWVPGIDEAYSQCILDYEDSDEACAGGTAGGGLS